MHILFVCHEYPPCNHGGIGSFTKDLAEGLVSSGHKVTVVGVYNSSFLQLKTPVIETISGVNVYRYPEKKTFSKTQLNSIHNRWYLHKLIKQINNEISIDLVESPESQGWLAFGVPINVPLITRLHGGETYFGVELNRASSRLNKFFEGKQLKNSDLLVSVSDYTARKTLEIFKSRSPFKVIYNSIKIPESFVFKSADDFKNKRIVFTGTLIPKKGVKELVMSMNYILKKYPDAELHLAGKSNYEIDGIPYLDTLYSLLECESYKARVKVLGPLDREKELFPLLSSAEVCCFPSYSEAFALTPLEAMAIGKAVVFTELCSGPEAIEHGVSGLLCNPKNPKDIAEKIMYYFDNKLETNIIKKNAKRRTEKMFGYNHWLDQNIKCYEDHISKFGDKVENEK